MSPSELKAMTLQQLRATRKAMFSAAWMLALQDADAAARTQAAQQMLSVNHAIMSLENQQLAAIRDQLIGNEPALVAGTEALTRALRDLRKVRDVLDAVRGVLGVVGKIVALL